MAVFGGMVGDDLLPLYVVNRSNDGKGFDGRQFCTILQELYLPILEEKFPDGNYRILLDNCPAHRGAFMREWQQDYPQLEDKFLFLPPYSFNSSPIEQIWSLLKRALAHAVHHSTPTLTNAIVQEWDRIAGEEKPVLLRLCSSMFRRIDAVAQANGGPTRY